MTLTPIRLSTPTAVPSSADCRETTEAATPAGWSPGSAWSGTVMVKGTTSLSPAATVTSSGMSIQVPAAVDSSSDASMSKRPVGVVNPSAAVRRKVSSRSPRFCTDRCSVTLWPASSSGWMDARSSGPDSSDAVTAQRVSGACGWPSAVVAVSTHATRASPSVTANVIRRVVMTWRCTALPRDGDPSVRLLEQRERDGGAVGDRKSTRLNSSHVAISYAVFCLKNKIQKAALLKRLGQHKYYL